MESLSAMAEAAGLPQKPFYKLSEIQRATGISVSTLRDEINAGRLRYLLPAHRTRGILVKVEWFDQWMEDAS